MARLDVYFSGANPNDQAGVRRTNGRSFEVRPFLEPTGGPAYKFRLDVRITADEPGETIRLAVEWREPKYMHLRGKIYHSRLDTKRCDAPHVPGTWKTASGITRGETSLFELRLSPGRHHICMQPRYDLVDLAGLAMRCAGSPFAEVREMRAGGGMPIHVFRLGRDPGRDDRPVIVVAARIHPYETAGSHCCHAAISAALSDQVFRDHLLAAYDWAIVPVASPDGVSAGFCRLSGRRGLGGDASREAIPGDPLLRLVRNLVRQNRLAGYLDIHNWMHPEMDGVSCRNRLGVLRFVRAMDRAGASTKPWRKTFRHQLLARPARGVMQQAAVAGADCLALEFPWNGRSTSDMAELGKASLLAFAETLQG